MKNKKILIISIITSIIIGGLLSYLVFGKTIEYTDKPLPAPELSEGLRGKYGIDKNINETTIDNYLNRSDTVYRDVRMLVDSASWENKGGDRYLTGYIKGFEVIPSPYLASYTDAYIKQKEKENVYGLYTGKTLFTLQEDGTYTPNYKESMEILEAIFPKDKNIFIICGAGGYAGQVKDMLISLGWNKELVRDIGGYWYYNGKNSVQVKETIDGKDYYNFSKVPYYNIDFDSLHEV
ncbi:MAG: hypothetical protein MR031_00405 [Tenericutes bacterium]|nr:hypothetical protein [Mycoplasmatota bacterium]